MVAVAEVTEAEAVTGSVVVVAVGVNGGSAPAAPPLSSPPDPLPCPVY